MAKNIRFGGLVPAVEMGEKVHSCKWSTTDWPNYRASRGSFGVSNLEQGLMPPEASLTLTCDGSGPS